MLNRPTFGGHISTERLIKVLRTGIEPSLIINVLPYLQAVLQAVW